MSHADWARPQGLNLRPSQQAEGLQSSFAAVVSLPEETGGCWQVVDENDVAGMALRGGAYLRAPGAVWHRGGVVVVDLLGCSSFARQPPGLRGGDVTALTYIGSQRLALDLVRPMASRTGTSILHLAVNGKEAMTPMSMVLDVAEDLLVK